MLAHTQLGDNGKTVKQLNRTEIWALNEVKSNIVLAEHTKPWIDTMK